MMAALAGSAAFFGLLALAGRKAYHRWEVRHRSDVLGRALAHAGSSWPDKVRLTALFLQRCEADPDEIPRVVSGTSSMAVLLQLLSMQAQAQAQSQDFWLVLRALWLLASDRRIAAALAAHGSEGALLMNTTTTAKGGAKGLMRTLHGLQQHRSTTDPRIAALYLRSAENLMQAGATRDGGSPVVRSRQAEDQEDQEAKEANKGLVEGGTVTSPRGGAAASPFMLAVEDSPGVGVGQLGSRSSHKDSLPSSSSSSSSSSENIPRLSDILKATGPRRQQLLRLRRSFWQQDDTPAAGSPRSAAGASPKSASSRTAATPSSLPPATPSRMV